MSSFRPGIYSLGDFQIGAAATQVGDWVTGLEGMSSVGVSARLAYGSGGSSVTVVIETSINQGLTALEIARFDFATSGDERYLNVTADQAVSLPIPAGSLSGEGTNQGMLGDRLRARVISAGTYAGSTVASVRASVR